MADADTFPGCVTAVGKHHDDPETGRPGYWNGMQLRNDYILMADGSRLLHSASLGSEIGKASIGFFGDVTPNFRASVSGYVQMIEEIPGEFGLKPVDEEKMRKCMGYIRTSIGNLGATALEIANLCDAGTAETEAFGNEHFNADIAREIYAMSSAGDWNGLSAVKVLCDHIGELEEAYKSKVTPPSTMGGGYMKRVGERLEKLRRQLGY